MVAGRPLRGAACGARRRAAVALAGAVLVAVAVVALAQASPPPARTSWELEPAGSPVAHMARSSVPVGGHPAAIVPFTPEEQRRTTRGDGLPPFWADRRSCSVGCRAPGARAGWPLLPFHSQHALRAGLNERRTGSMHVGVDIQARDLAGVYALQPGRARILQRTGIDARVQVGRFIYWHIYPRVREGQWVTPFRTLVGRVQRHLGHLHLSEVLGRERYLNPLRPGGRVLSPWADRSRPVIGLPEFGPGGVVNVRAYDPQSFTTRTTYYTPVLAPAALAYRVRTATGRPVTPLRFALRGSQHYPFALVNRIHTPDARGAGFLCFVHSPRCTPNWHYRLAGGLAPRLPALRGMFRLTIYAWDWAGNTRARDAVFWAP